MTVREALKLAAGIEDRQNVARGLLADPALVDKHAEMGMVLEDLKQYAGIVNEAIDKVTVEL